MPSLNPTIAGSVKQSKTSIATGGLAWTNGQPYNDSTGTATFTGVSNQQAIYTLFGYVGASISATDIRITLLSFDTSDITSTPASATLTIYGRVNSGTGNPSGHSTDGILCLKTTMGAADGIESADWGRIDLDGDGPTTYSDTLTSWNVGTSTPNTFTFNSNALADMTNNDTIQIGITHKFFVDHYDSNPPFAHGNNSPNGDDDFTATAGAYWSDATYQPKLNYTMPSPKMGVVHLNSGKMTLSSGKFSL